VIVGPGVESSSIRSLTDGSLDLACTVLDVAGIAPPPSYDGATLQPVLLRGDTVPAMDNRVIVSMRSGADWRGAV